MTNELTLAKEDGFRCQSVRGVCERLDAPQTELTESAQLYCKLLDDTAMT